MVDNRERGHEAPPNQALEGLKADVEMLVTMNDTVGETPDFSHIWATPEYAALSDADKAALGAHVRELGHEPPKGAVPSPENDRTTPRDTSHLTAKAMLPGRTEVREGDTERRPVKRQFMGYRVENSETGRMLVEEFSEWDEESNRYAPRTVKTDIALPAYDQERFAKAAAALRNELDEKQVKIFFDQSKDDPATLKPKWKFTLDGKTKEIHLSEADLPDEIIRLVKGDAKGYYRAPEWQRWFGPAMQAQREKIISDTLATRFIPEIPPADKRPAINRAEAKSVDVSDGLATLIEKFAPLFDLPKDAKEMISLVTQFANGVFRYRRERAHKPTEGRLDQEELSLIEDALVRHFKDDPDTLRIIDDAFNGKESAAGIEDAKEAARIRDIKDPKELEQVILQLSETAERGNMKARERARMHLLDIEFGRAGETSELRMNGVVRENGAKRFFAEHPALDRRNIEWHKDGRITAHLDRIRAEDALARAIDALMRDAVRRMDDEQARRETVDYFTRLVSGARDKADAAIKVFRENVAAFDRAAAELEVKDHQRLTIAMRAAYESVMNGRK
jgi:hypothetical protein